MDRTAHRAAVEAGYASLNGYIEQWGDKMTERHADDITLQELVRLRVENERLQEENGRLKKALNKVFMFDGEVFQLQAKINNTIWSALKGDE